MKTAAGWSCAPGYSGTALAGCASDQRCCEVSLTLQGCLPTLPCAAPHVTDPCMFDTEGCNSVAPGAECTVLCRAPYTGSPAELQCPQTNVLPGVPVLGLLPQCQTSCPDPAPPLGYDRGADGTWQCAAGFGGTVTRTCPGPTGSSCRNQEAILYGCAMVTNCVPPVLDCMFSTCNSSGFSPGAWCNISCVAPYQGLATQAYCPSDNINSTKVAEFHPPACTLECPVPTTVPPGYKLVGKSWQCSSGYTGKAVAACSSTGDCRPQIALSGCNLLVPCAALQADQCMYDTSNCQSLQPGQSCTVTCITPFAGTISTATCPAQNTDPQAALTWKPQSCFCRDPSAAPRGYTSNSSGWFCDSGFVGIATKSCRGDLGMCLQQGSSSRLSGCMQPAPCSVPAFFNMDPRTGFISGSLSFGPAEANGLIDEKDFEAYEVAFADDCGVPLSGQPIIAVVQRWPVPSVDSCCTPAKYQLTIGPMSLPAGATQLVVAMLGATRGAKTNVGTSVAIQQGVQSQRTGNSNGNHAWRRASISCWFLSAIALFHNNEAVAAAASWVLFFWKFVS